MRHTIAIFLSFAILCIVGLGCTHAFVNRERDHVTLTETTLQGDKSAADGLTIRAINQYVHRLTWDTTLTTGENSFAVTEFTPYKDALDYGDYTRTFPGINFDIHYDSGLDTEKDPALMAPIERIYREMFDATEPGHESEQTIRVKDYYEYYPLIFDIDLPYYFLHHYESNTLPIEEDKAALVSHYRDYFRIPVLEDEYLHISVRKGPTNTIGSGSGSVEHGDSFFLYPYTANTDDAMYFLFDAHTRKDKLVDTSMIAGGFGIYCQPYEFDAETSANTIDPAKLTTVYPLDPNIRPGILSYNEARKQLQLLAVEDGQIMLYFIDEETYTLLQKISVGSLSDDQGVWAHVFHDDYIVITTSDGRLAVIAADDSGAYSLQFCLTFETGSLIRHLKSSFADTAWNGEQLAMVAHDYEGENCNFYLLVFDAAGVLYCGEYKSSLSTGNDEKYRYHVHPGNNDALTVEWIE